MATIQTRRRLLSSMALAIPAAALPLRRAAALEPPLETTTLRLAREPVICFAPQYVCEQLLRAEGFAEIHYVDVAKQACQFAPVRAREISPPTDRNRTDD